MLRDGLSLAFRISRVLRAKTLRSLRQISYLLARQGGLRHRTLRGPDKNRYTVDELRVHGGALIRGHCGSVRAEIDFITLKFVPRRLILEHNQLTIVLQPGLKPHRHLSQVRVTDVLALFVDHPLTMGPAT
jgi:hypothetical protein